MQDPFYHKQKRGKNSRMLDADAWLEGVEKLARLVEEMRGET